MQMLRLPALITLIIMAACSSTPAQGFRTSPYAAPSTLRRADLTPPQSSSSTRPSLGAAFCAGSKDRPCGSSNTKNIPNLQGGYILRSGVNRREGFLTLDYLVPIPAGKTGVVFGEAHFEAQVDSSGSDRDETDILYLSGGGGYRRLVRKNTLIGVNFFLDRARFSDRWLSSGGLGIETALLMNGHDALDVNFNWYGDLSQSDFIINEYRDGPYNFDLEIGYSHQLFHGGPDLRLYGAAYEFNDASNVYGRLAGFELTTADGVASVKCETAHDPVNGSYQILSASLNVGFNLGNLLSGRNPFSMPERLFNSPRNFDRFTEKVRRRWRHTTHGLMTASGPQTITVVNNRSNPITLYMGFIGPIGWGKYTAKDFSGFAVAPASCNGAGNVLHRTLKPKERVVITFDPSKGQVSPAFSADRCLWNCTPTTQQTIAEFTLQGWKGDWMDISLVNGFNYPMEISYVTTKKTDTQIIQVLKATGNTNVPGVYPLKCDLCNSSSAPGCNMAPDQSECSPDNQCQLLRPYGADYVLSILPN